MRRLDIVDRIAKELKSFVPEAETILYGSETRGDARHNSDINLLKLLPDFKYGNHLVKRRSEISGRLFELSLELKVKISPLILSRNLWISCNTPVTVNVKNEEIRI